MLYIDILACHLLNSTGTHSSKHLLYSHFLEDTGLGGKGGKRGGHGGHTKNGFGATPYFLVIAEIKKDEKAFSSVSTFCTI